MYIWMTRCIERSNLADFNGKPVRVLAREDLFVIKSLVFE